MEASISGSSLKIIQAALPEAKVRSLDLDLYRVAVYEDKGTVDGKPYDRWVVSFVDVNAPKLPAHPGNPGKIPGVEVLIQKQTLAVIGAHFIR